LIRRTVTVDGERVSYGVGGEGLPVVFLHGWGLGHQAYRRALRRLTGCGCRVYAPALPGFGGTADLPCRQRTIAGYAAWVAKFLEAVGEREPVFVVGHSFGGGVAIRFAHDFPAHVRYLVLINSVGSTSWNGMWGMDRLWNQRPLWDLAFQFARELVPSREMFEVARSVADDFTANLIRNPWGIVEIGLLARSVDLTKELAELGRRHLPVLLLSSTKDGVIPLESFDALCTAIGTEGRLVDGRHSWLLADPDAFREVLDNVLSVQVAEHHTRGMTARAARIAELLEGTAIPHTVVADLLHGASALWMVSDRPEVLAGDLALCHPALAPDEVRAVARGVDDGASRLTVVAHDRPGLLADTCAVIALIGGSVTSAAAATWTDRNIALHALTFQTPQPLTAADWDALGQRLRQMQAGADGAPRFKPVGRARVTASSDLPGRAIVRVTAPDQVGLLWAICRWFADQGISIEATKVSTEDKVANDAFVVHGYCDADALAAHVSRRSHRPQPVAAMCRMFPFRLAS
jgi:pimeloyl-ACP methyl ester carboxylesterase/glycine cleavage system regulatory protein